MRLEGADLLLLELQLRFPFVTSFANISSKQTVVIRLWDSLGRVGYGETPVFQDPLYVAEYTSASMDVLQRYLVPAVLGHDTRDVSELQTRMSHVRGYMAAKAGVEAAWLDLCSQERDCPVGMLMGSTRDWVPAGISLGVEPNVPALLRRIEDATESGYERIKLKIKPGWDLEPVRAVRDKFGGIPLSLDANGAYGSVDLPIWKELDEFGLIMIEQPLGPDRLLDHARLQADLSTPICLDESVTSSAVVRDAIEAGAARVFCIKPSQVGGYQLASEIARLCRDSGMSAWVGGMLETGIGKSFAVQLASLDWFDMPADISGTDRYFVEDVLTSPMSVYGGRLQVPRQIGLVNKVDEERIAALTIELRSVTAPA